jgi:hypothetical protein
VTASVESNVLCLVRQRHHGSTQDPYLLNIAHECSGPSCVMRASIGNGSHPQTYPSQTYIGVLDPTYLHSIVFWTLSYLDIIYEHIMYMILHLFCNAGLYLKVR